MAVLKKIFSWFWPQKTTVFAGKISPVLEITYERGRKVLNGERVNYSFGTLHEVFRIAFEVAKVKQQNPQSVLILGFGAGSIATILTKELSLRPMIIGIEADETVIRIFRDEFDGKNYPDLELRQERAEHYVATTTKKFDLIAIDVFVEEFVPPEIRSEEFLMHVRRLLQKGGMVVMNEIAAENASDEFHARFKRILPEMQMHIIRKGELPNRIYIGKNKETG
ncbi:MAG TPA: methyltransferase domain-containing protein [Bacteroidia bacterium]|nr:methyltransferase domain-containing protein [Bacteroidia bacterium]